MQVKFIGPANIRKISEDAFGTVEIDADDLEAKRGEVVVVTEVVGDYLLRSEPQSWELISDDDDAPIVGEDEETATDDAAAFE